jgi:hypothetical protein
MLEAPISSHKTVNVTVVSGNLIQCGANGGNLRLKSKTTGGAPLQVKWTWVGTPAGQQFRLQFFALALEDDPAETASAWPFREDEPEASLTPLATEHTYTLQDINHLGKYSVLVNSLHLDPIIIVEK